MSSTVYRFLLRKLAAQCPTCKGTGQTNIPSATELVQSPKPVQPTVAVNQTQKNSPATGPTTNQPQPPIAIPSQQQAPQDQYKANQKQVNTAAENNSKIIGTYSDYVDNGLKALQADRDRSSHTVGDVWDGATGRQDFDNTAAKNAYESRANQFFSQKQKIDQSLRNRGIYGNMAMRRLQELQRDGLSRDEAMKIINSEERERLQNEQWAREEAKAAQSQPKTARLGSVSKPYTKVISNRYADASKRSNDALTKLEGLI